MSTRPFVACAAMDPERHGNELTEEDLSFKDKGSMSELIFTMHVTYTKTTKTLIFFKKLNMVERTDDNY